MNIVDDLIELAEDHVRRVLLQLKLGRLTATWVIVDKKGEPHIVPTPWENDYEKRLGESLIRRQIHRYQARAYSFVTEAWQATAPADWNPETPLPSDQRPMNRVDRQEVVLAFAMDKEGHSQTRRWIIHRDWNEQIVGLEASNDDFVRPEGWMVEMFEE